ncbi:unnamed protein product [Sphagnum jensenii]|uniref:Uncharacterized protein n=1 Tax=Sphagnum jensenii TaxID=128206 RepID=A0ABP0X8U0_9BRYO
MAVSFSLDHGFGGFQEEMATGTSDEAAQDSDEWRNYLTCKLSLAAFQALGISPAVLVINPPDLVKEWLGVSGSDPGLSSCGNPAFGSEGLGARAQG